MQQVTFLFASIIDMSVLDMQCTIVHTRHNVAGALYDSSVYLPVPLLACVPEQALYEGAMQATQQVDFVVQTTRNMRIL